jgi:hypothetical protein
MLTPRKRREMSKRRQIVINRTGPPVEKPAREQGSWEPVLSPEKLKAELWDTGKSLAKADQRWSVGS